jgi:elongation factor Ts
MTIIDASLVRDLREKTGAGMMDCKKALIETKGDFEGAVKWLRTKGLSAAAKKADRIAAEGLVAAKVNLKTGVLIEVNSETDFVARNDKFQNLVNNIASLGLSYGDIDSLKVAKMPSGKTVSEEIIENIATIGENLSLRRINSLNVAEGIVSSYVHNSVAPDLGRIAVIVALESKADQTKLMQIGKQIAMHIAATKPQSLNIESLDQALIQREKDVFSAQSKASGKPDNIIEKMVEGRIRKFFEEVVLLEQIFVIDSKTKISDLLSNAAKELGNPIKITGFVRYEIGEGIEQEQKNFADEVAAVIKQ